jgi:hypothetical protein
MEPRDQSQPWPTGIEPTRAWTKEIAGKAYTVKPIDERLWGIWRDVEELGTFQLSNDTPPRAIAPADLTLEARGVVDVFLAEMDRHAACRSPNEHRSH